MNAEDVMAIITERGLSMKQMFKLYRILEIRVGLALASEVGKDMQQREPELFGPHRVLAASNEHGPIGQILLPWDKGYDSKEAM